MTLLFEPLAVGDLHLPNRIAMAPLTRNRAPASVPTGLMAQYYAQRASAGLLISEATAISERALGYSDVPGLWTDEQVQGWRKVTEAVHQSGGRIVAQLWHVGRVSHFSLQPGGRPPVAPSPIAARTKTYLIQRGVGTFQATSEPRALQTVEMAEVVGEFRRSAHRAVNEAGFDGVEIHGANGYLLDQFLRTSANQRDDAYGGPIENRTRLTVEVARAVASEVGGGRTGLRLSPVSPANDVADEAPQPLFDHLMRALAPMDLAYIHVVEGSTGSARTVDGQPFSYAQMLQAYRDAGGTGAWMVNNGYDKTLAEAALAAGTADLVSFGRAFIANPDLVERMKRGASLNTAERSTFYGGGARGYTDYPRIH